MWCVAVHTIEIDYQHCDVAALEEFGAIAPGLEKNKERALNVWRQRPTQSTCTAKALRFESEARWWRGACTVWWWQLPAQWTETARTLHYSCWLD